VHKAGELGDKYGITIDALKKAWKILFLNYHSETQNLLDDDYNSFLSRGYELIINMFEMKKRWEDKTIVIANERYIRLPYENKFLKNVFLSGKIDVILKNKIEEVFTALDWKTARKTKTQKDADKDLQLSFYIYFIHKLFNAEFKNIHACLAYPSSKRLVFTQRTKEELQIVMFDKIDNMLKRIKENDFYKEPKKCGNLNNCTFCPYIISCDKRNK